MLAKKDNSSLSQFVLFLTLRQHCWRYLAILWFSFVVLIFLFSLVLVPSPVMFARKMTYNKNLGGEIQRKSNRSLGSTSVCYFLFQGLRERFRFLAVLDPAEFGLGLRHFLLRQIYISLRRCMALRPAQTPRNCLNSWTGRSS